MYTLFDRMLGVELLRTLAAILLVLVVIIVSRKFLGVLDKALEGELSGDTIFILLGLKTLSSTAILLPAAAFMSILTVLGRLYRDQEMAALASAGVGFARTLKALSWLLIPLSLLSAYLSLDVMPWSERQSQILMNRDEKTADIRGFKPGRFNEFSQGDVVLYAEQLGADNTLDNVFVHSRQSNSVGIVLARHGLLERNPNAEYFVVLREGKRYQGVPGQADFVISEFAEHGVRLETVENETASLKREAENTLELWQSHTPKELAELQKRLAAPFGMLFLGLLAVPLAQMAPRGGMYGNIFIALVVYILFENMQKITQGLLMTGKISLLTSYTLAYVVLMVATLVLIVKRRGWHWLIRSVRERFGA
ncbi:MAG: LPS export ABC transporter permease LptF [Methylococcaceae bacterium]